MADQNQLTPRPQSDGQLVVRPEYLAPEVRYPLLNEDRDSPNLLRVLDQFKRRRKAIVIIVCCALLLAAAVSLVQQPAYKAVASVEVQGRNENFLNLNNVQATTTSATETPESEVSTQAELLREDSLIQQALVDLKAENHPEFKESFSLGSWINSALQRSHPAAEDRSHWVKTAKGNLRVEPARSGRLIRIEYRSHDPKLAAAFPNALADALIRQQLEKRWEATAQVSEWLRPELSTLKKNVQESEAKMQSYAQQSGFVLAGGTESIAESKLRDIQRSYSDAKADRIAKESAYQTLAKSSPESSGEAFANPVVTDQKTKLNELRREKARLSALFKPNNYQVEEVQAAIDALETAMQAEYKRTADKVKNEYITARGREEMLAAASAQQEALVADLARKQLVYNDLKREAEVNRKLYEGMFERVKEAGVASAVRPSHIRLVTQAQPPTEPFTPNWPLNLSIGLFGGVTLAVGYVFMKMNTEQVLTLPGEASSFLNLPELGAIPRNSSLQISRGEPNARAVITGSRTLDLETWESRLLGVSECFRLTLTSLFTPFDKSAAPQVVVVTSPLPMEGKTTVASNLAVALASINRRVLLVDGDLRCPQLHKTFALNREDGLSDLLQADALDAKGVMSLVQETGVPNLHVLSGGSLSRKFPAKLYSERYSDLVRLLRNEYEHILIDAPPALLFADCEYLAHPADGIVLVLRANQTSWTSAVMAAQKLRLVNVPLLGTILNDWNPEDASSSYGYGNMYHYYEHHTARS